MEWILFSLGLAIGTAYGTILGESKGRQKSEEERRKRIRAEKHLKESNRRHLDFQVSQSDEIERLKGANEYLRTEYQRRKLYEG